MDAYESISKIFVKLGFQQFKVRKMSGIMPLYQVQQPLLILTMSYTKSIVTELDVHVKGFILKFFFTLPALFVVKLQHNFWNMKDYFKVDDI